YQRPLSFVTPKNQSSSNKSAKKLKNPFFIYNRGYRVTSFKIGLYSYEQDFITINFLIMKTFINFYLPSLAIVGLLFLSCSKDDVPAPPPQDACDNKSIIMLSTDYNNNPSTGIEYIGYDLNSPIQGPGMPVGSHANTSNLKLIMPPNSSIYSKSDKLHGVIINEVYYSFDLNNFTTTENTIAPEMVAPVISGNNAYIIEMVTPYPNMGESAS